MNPIHTATMSAAEDALSSNVSAVSYPRTGKRGVPQQFARRLYEMLQSETKLAMASPDQTVFISWSDSSLAFRIHDVDGFTSSVLPKYFRTKKFSSFQRNLNLYGFAKMRRGPDTDMYAHQSFTRGNPELLLHIRKSSAASRRKMSTASIISDDSSDSSGSSSTRNRDANSETESSSPIISPRTIVDPFLSRTDTSSTLLSYEHNTNQTWLTFRNQPLISNMSTCLPKTSGGGAGRLDLLALAVEHATF